MTNRILLTAALCLGIGAAFVGAQDAPKARDRFDRDLRVGTVNVADLFVEAKSEKWKDVNAEIRTLQAAIQKQITDMEARALQLKNAIETLTKDSPLYFKKLEEYETLKNDIASKAKIGQAQLAVRMTQLQLAYTNTAIKEAVQAVATALKLDLILRLEEPSMPEDSTENVIRRTNQRVVLFSNGELDITKEVLERLNKK